MTYFVRNGNLFRPMDELNLDLHKTLPTGNYILKQDQNGNIFLEVVDSFNFPTKRYGNNVRHTQRIIDTFMARDASTGVMLAGEKGSGKSLLAKTVSIEAYKLDIPTIIINAPWHGDAFNSFIQGIDQPAIILFDEFEKVYDQDQQEAILTLLDGVFPSKKLFVLTCNDKWRVDTHMRNRPGRIFYMIEFKGLDKSFIVEYCNDNLKNRQYIEKICNIASMYAKFNFDMLKALVEEMNRYGETPEQALELLNSRPEFSDSSRYDIEVTYNGKALKCNPTRCTGNPLNLQMAVEYLKPVKAPRTKNKVAAVEQVIVMNGGRGNWTLVEISHNDLVKIDADEGMFAYKKNDVTITLKRQTDKSFDYRNSSDYF